MTIICSIILFITWSFSFYMLFVFQKCQGIIQTVKSNIVLHVQHCFNSAWHQFSMVISILGQWVFQYSLLYINIYSTEVRISCSILLLKVDLKLKVYDLLIFSLKTILVLFDAFLQNQRNNLNKIYECLILR